MADGEKTGAMPLSELFETLNRHDAEAARARRTQNEAKTGEDGCDCAACQRARAMGLPGNTVEEMRAQRDARKPEWARGRMGDKEKEYDEFIVPQLQIVIDLCEAHGIPFVSFFQLSDEDHMGGARVLDVPGCNEALLSASDAVQHWINLPDAILEGMKRGAMMDAQTVYEGAVPAEMGEAILRILKKKMEDEGGARE